MGITGDSCPRYGVKCSKLKGKKMENTKNSEIFSNEELGKAIETYNLYIANRETFKKVYNEDCEYDENKSFIENAKDEINCYTAKGKIETTVPDAIMLAAYVFEKAVCPVLKDREIEISKIHWIPTYGEDPFPEFDIKIENENSQKPVLLVLDCEAFRIGGAFVAKETKNNITLEKIFKGKKEEFIDKSDEKDLSENIVFSKNKFEFSSNTPLSLDCLNEKIIPQITKDCKNLIEEAFLQNN